MKAILFVMFLPFLVTFSRSFGQSNTFKNLCNTSCREAFNSCLKKCGIIRPENQIENLDCSKLLKDCRKNMDQQSACYPACQAKWKSA